MKNWFILLLFSFSLFSCGLKTRVKQELTTKVKIGESAPNFSFTDKDGRKQQLSDLKGKVVFINFFATYCGICMTEMPRIQKDLFEQYKNDSDFVVLAVGQNSLQDLIAFKERKKLEFPIIPDENGIIYNLYASDLVPRNFVVDKEGKLIYCSVGFQEPEFEKIKLAIANQLR